MRSLRQADSINRALSINICRFVVGSWRRVLSTVGPTDNCLLSTTTKERSYTFQLFIDGEEALSPTFRLLLERKYSQHFSAEEIFGFIYAILHSSTYRTSYCEFLKRAFPRIPIPKDLYNFEQLSRLGWALVEAHLIKNLPRQNLAAYQGKGQHEIEFVRYSEADHSIAINTTQSFRPVPQAIWDFHIGGYQVLDKYLKSRKGRKLSLGEIDHVAKVADALDFTIDQMAKIDEAYVAAFPDRG
jgi:predicted helicase